MIQTLGISIIVGLIGYFILDVFVDGVLQEPFAKTVVYSFQRLGMQELEAIHLYRLIFWQNKGLIIGAGFFVLFLFSFYLGMSRFTTYLRQVETGIQMILNESNDKIDLPDTLEPLEDKLNGIKENLKEQRRNIEETEQRKNDIIVYLAHDLKTPLTSIVSYIDLLEQEKNLPEHVKDYIRILGEKSERLKNIVQDVFEVSKAASGQLPVHLEELDFGKLLRQTLADMNIQIEKSELTLRTTIPEEPVLIQADGQRLYRVFQNLIQNALQYSLKGSRVYLTLTTQDGKACASVKNISAAELDTNTDFTERFVRGDTSRSDGGNGLGLSIAKSFTEACGGELQVKAEADLFVASVIFPVKN